MCVRTLLRLQHTRENSSGGPQILDAHGLPQRPVFQRKYASPLPDVGKSRKLRQMVEESGTHSADLQSPESAEHLCAKCDRYAEQWKPVADKLWQENRKKKKASENFSV